MVIFEFQSTPVGGRAGKPSPGDEIGRRTPNSRQVVRSPCARRVPNLARPRPKSDVAAKPKSLSALDFRVPAERRLLEAVEAQTGLGRTADLWLSAGGRWPAMRKLLRQHRSPTSSEICLSRDDQVSELMIEYGRRVRLSRGK